MLKRMSVSALVCLTFLLLGAGTLLAKKNPYDARQHGFDHGYREGYHHALQDRAASRRADIDDLRDYKRGDVGYESYMGNRGQYKKGFREGFKEGYNDAWTGRASRLVELYPVPVTPVPPATVETPYPGYYAAPRGWGYQDVAFDNGYSYGLRDGMDDLNHHRDFNPDRHDVYQDADKGFHGSYGSRTVYQQNFRQGYYQGYQDGFGRLR